MNRYRNTGVVPAPADEVRRLRELARQKREEARPSSVAAPTPSVWRSADGTSPAQRKAEQAARAKRGMAARKPSEAPRPDGYLTAREIAEQIGQRTESVADRIRRWGIPTVPWKRGRGKPTNLVAIADAERLWPQLREAA